MSVCEVQNKHVYIEAKSEWFCVREELSVCVSALVEKVRDLLTERLTGSHAGHISVSPPHPHPQ